MKNKGILIGLLSTLIIPSALADIGSTLQNVWFKILNLGNLGFLGIPDGSLVVAFTRILIWIFIFAALFALTTSLGGSSGALSFLKRNHAMIISFVIATIASIFIPSQVILAVGAGWATAVALLLIGGPIVAIALLFWKLPNKPCPYLFVKLLISLLILWILTAMKVHTAKMTTVTGSVVYSVQSFIGYSITIMIIIAIYYFIRWLMCLFGHFSDGGGGFRNPFKFAKVHGDIQDKDTHAALKSRVSLERGGKIIRSKNCTGKYDFAFLRPGDYKVTSHPLDKNYSPLTNSITLENKDNKESNFLHKKGDHDKNGKLHGIIIDKNTKDPIQSKISIIKDGRYIRYNHYTGKYAVDNLEAGDYKLISRPVDPKYNTITIEVSIEDNESKEVDFLHEEAVDGKGKFYGTIKSTKGDKIKSVISLYKGGTLVKQETFMGKYEFPGLEPGDYRLVSKPKNKKYEEIIKTASLTAREAKEVNFVHPFDDDDDDDKSYKWRNFLFSLIDFLENKVLKKLEDDDGDATKNIKNARKSWESAKGKMTVAIKLAEKYFAMMNAKMDLTPGVIADIDGLIKKLKHARLLMDRGLDRGFDIANRKATAQRIRKEFIYTLGHLKELTGKLVKKIARSPLKT
jgi:hypothetical protein